MSTTVPAHVQAVRDERAADPVYVKHQLCLDCGSAATVAVHQPGYKMARVPWDIPGHAFVAPPAADAGHDPSGRACALAGRVARGDAVADGEECAACMADIPGAIPRMTSEVLLPREGAAGTMTIVGRQFAVRVEVVRGREVIMLRGVRGAEYGLMAYLDQPTPGVVHMFALNPFRVGSDPFGRRGIFVRVGQRLGWVAS